jgi:hypothetical protein
MQKLLNKASAIDVAMQHAASEHSAMATEEWSQGRKISAINQRIVMEICAITRSTIGRPRTPPINAHISR